MLVENILLEELEGFDAPSAVGEEETQVVLANSLPGRQKTQLTHSRGSSKPPGSWSNSAQYCVYYNT